MSETASGRAIATSETGRGQAVSGWDRIDAPALIRTAQAIAAAALQVPFASVSARVVDDGRGALALTVTAPLTVPMLGRRDGVEASTSASMTGSAVSAVAAAHRARSVIAEQMQRITGRRVSRVDVDFAAAVIAAPRRVR